jgi:hypothetical protein
MTATVDTPRAAAPWHLWVVGIVSLLWNGYGAYDYLMSKTQGEAYYRQLGATDAQIAFMNGYPMWMQVVWAIGIWGGVLGAVLLLLRTRYALHAFVASLAAFVVSLVYTYALSDGGQIQGQTGMIMSGLILISCLAFAWYAWTMTKRGVLR